MNILLSTDNNYVMPTGVLMHSIGINNPSKIHYYILVNESIAEENKCSLQKIASKYGDEIDFYVVGKELTEYLPFGRENMPKHVSIACYYRLFVTKILPDTLHKIIYLDGDMIVRKNLEPLWNIDLTDYALACAHDQDEIIHINSARLDYPMKTYGYFNSGMLVINLDYWRKHNFLNRFIDYVAIHGSEIKLHDQDVLNETLYKEKKWVSVSFNMQTGFLHEDNLMHYVDNIYGEVGEAMQDPAIIHYCAADKPWQLYSCNPYVRVWRYYWRKSEWRNMRLEGENPNNIRHHISAYLFRRGCMVKKKGRLKVLLKR